MVVGGQPHHHQKFVRRGDKADSHSEQTNGYLMGDLCPPSLPTEINADRSGGLITSHLRRDISSARTWNPRQKKKKMNRVKDGWFSEVSDLWPGQCTSLQVEEVLYEGKSQYQDIVVLKTKSHGRVLVLDGIIQCAESDEFSYQEMISFLPLCAHANPQKVLIVGGGDGGVAREVSKHPLVREIVQVEIDEQVIAASKKFLPFMSKGFASDKLTLQVCDGFEYMRNHKNEFDVIITDSSDPIGPAVNLFTDSYFHLLKQALKPNGIISSQAGTIWAGLEHVKQTLQHCRNHFDTTKYALTNVPTYPTGQIGFIIGSNDKANDLTAPKLKERDLKSLGLKYYNTEIHSAAFTLPNFAARVLK